MSFNPTTASAVNSLPVSESAERNRHHHRPMSPMAAHLRKRWGCSPEIAIAVCEAWGFEGGSIDA